MLRFFCLVTSLFFFGVVNAQSPNFKHFTVENNLPSSECYQVLQDKKGYIWIATDKGVARFDGNNFQNFTKEDGLPENCIIRMYEDPYGRIWFAGISRKIAYFENNKITCLKINDQFSKKKEFGIINSMAFCDNTLWIGMYGTPSIYKIIFSKEKKSNVPSAKKNRLKNQKLVEINQYKKINNSYLFKLKNGEILYGDAGAMHKKIKIGNFHYISPTKNHTYKTIFSNLVGSRTNFRITPCPDKHYLLNLNNNIIKINHRNGKSIKKMVFRESINYSLADSKNGIWLGTDKNGVLYYPKGDIEKSVPFHFLKNKTASCIMEDREHGFWISTLDDGIFYLKNIHFFHLTELSSKKVNTLLYHNNTLFAGLDNGRVVHFRNPILTETKANATQSDVNFINKIAPNNSHSIAIGGSIGFGYMDLKTNTCSWIKSYFAQWSKKSTVGAVSFIKSREKNTYWIANYTCLVKVFDTDKTKHIPFKHRIYSLAEDDHGILWLGSVNGLFSYDDGKFTFNGKNSTALSGRINDLQLKNNTLWAATKNDGVTIKKGNQLYDITTKNGLNSNICQSIFLESEKTGWIATNKGVSKITVISWKPFKLKVKTYSMNNGLISNEVNHIIKHGNIVYIASNKGITWFDEQKVKPNKVSPPIYITDVEINNADTTVYSTYHLPYYKNKISFNFIGLTYKSEGNVEYKYRLRGLDDAWTNSSYAKANFYNLSHGDYTFEVIAKNNDGVWSTKPAHIHLIISPPFWHTWTFRIITGLAFFGSIYWFIRWRINKVEKRALENAKLYQQTIDMEMKFLSSQMNPHFTFNAMNSIQYYMMENEPEKAQKYLVKYSKLIRKVLENNMKKYVPITEETEMLSLYMDIESLRFEIQFDYEITIPENLKALHISIPPMIIQPYIENAIWHGISNRKEVKGKILISFEMINDKLRCTIEDNGVGRAKAKELKSIHSKKESLGMLITHQRLQHLHSESEMEMEPEVFDMINENGIYCGTKVVISLPFLIDKNFESIEH